MPATRDLHCIRCGRELFDVVTEYQNYPDCPKCGGHMVYTPTRFFTDVAGSEQVSRVLEDGSGRPLTWHSTREREAKMRAMGYEPAGDKVGGARREFGDYTPENAPPRKKWRTKVEISAG